MQTFGKGWVEVICGPMFSGKSEELIRRLRRARIAKQRVQVFKPTIDIRYAVAKVVSHAGHEFDAVPLENSMQILAQVHADTSVVAIDEAQFFDWQIAEVVYQLAESGKRVILAGLDTDFRAEPFGPMPILLAEAEIVEKLHAICIVCGQEATRTQRLIDGRPARYDDPVVLVGGAEAYEARCRQHHEVPGSPRKQ
ncbi:MAG TPA: thymidine kinase [Anaerolineales bacterium]|nr:thymidine kinase [Anaerolineales bacterium]